MKEMQIVPDEETSAGGEETEAESIRDIDH